MNRFYFIATPQRRARLDFKLWEGERVRKRNSFQTPLRNFCKSSESLPRTPEVFAGNKMKFQSARYTLQSASRFRCTAAELNRVITIRTLRCLVHILFKLNHIDYSNSIGKKQFFFFFYKGKKAKLTTAQCAASCFQTPGR